MKLQDSLKEVKKHIIAAEKILRKTKEPKAISILVPLIKHLRQIQKEFDAAGLSIKFFASDNQKKCQKNRKGEKS